METAEFDYLQNLKEWNEKFKAIQTTDSKELKNRKHTREWLLSLNDSKISQEQRKLAFTTSVAFGRDLLYKEISYNRLAVELHDYYMLDLVNEKGKYKVVPSYNCWLNLKTSELAAKPNTDPFEDENCLFYVNDYRVCSEKVEWFELVEGL